MNLKDEDPNKDFNAPQGQTGPEVLPAVPEKKVGKALSIIEQVRGDITAMESEFKRVLPPQIPVEKFARVAITAIQMNPELLAANRKTLFGELMKCATDGLVPDGREAAITTYNTKEDGKVAKYLPMIGGILKKVRNSGELASITAQIIHEKDKFKYWVDADGEHIDHEPNLFDKRGEWIGVYALAKTKDGAVYIEVLTADQVKDVRDVSRAKNGPWNGPFESEMWKKTAIRRLSKKLPMSTDVEEVIRRDDDLIDFGRADAATRLTNRFLNAPTQGAEGASP